MHVTATMAAAICRHSTVCGESPTAREKIIRKRFGERRMTVLRGYLHDVWLCPDDFGNRLPACIPHGPDGDAARSLNEPGSEWVWTFWASSHADAMSIYYSFVGYGKYLPSVEDLLPYSQAMCERQAEYLTQHPCSDQPCHRA